MCKAGPVAGREGRRISSRVAAVRARLDERRREVEDRDRQAFGIRDEDVSNDEPAHAVSGGGEAQAEHPVPAPVRALAEWSWRLLVIAAALAILVVGLWYVRVVTFPLVAAALLAALLGPFCTRLRGRGWSRGASAVTVFVGFLVVVVGSLWAVAVVVGDQFGDVADSVRSGLREVQTWLDWAPFGLTREQIDAWFLQAGQVVEENQEVVTEGARSAATFVVQLGAGLAIMLFALIFFLYDGQKIWSWILRLVPRAQRNTVAGAGAVAWRTLTSYTHGTILVALFDAVFICIVLLVVGVPLAFPLAVLVFFGAFIPFVGAFVSGFIAVLVALVSVGFVAALLVLAGILGVQQIEGNLLQPFLLGRMVRVHPLGVLVAVSIGVLVAGIIGAVIAVPVVAVANTVGRYLAGGLPPPPPPTVGPVGRYDSDHGQETGSA